MDFQICKYCKIKSKAARMLTDEELQNLGSHCAEVNFKRNDNIFKQGALSSNIIYIKSGIVKLHIKGPKTEQIIKIAKAPSYLGIPTTFDQKINSYSATAISDTTVCFIDISLFRKFINTNGKFAYEIILELCKNEVDTFKRCVNRTQKNTPGRLADALLLFRNEIFESNEFKLPLSRQEIAGYIDTSRENVSRLLTEFAADGIVEIKGKTIKILKPKLLETISRNG